jgi:hypothetical protein
LADPERTPDLRSARQEHKRVSLRGKKLQRDLFLKRPARVRAILHSDGIELSFAAQDRTVAQVPRYRIAVERGGHHQQAQVGTLSPPQAIEERQRNIAFHMAFVEFVEHDDRDTTQLGI